MKIASWEGLGVKASEVKHGGGSVLEGR